LTIRASTVSGNRGSGVVFLVGAQENRLDIASSTIVGNTVAGVACVHGVCGPMATILIGPGATCDLLPGRFPDLSRP
jgi:hypothetical protein